MKEENITPLMKQYLQLKQKYKEYILLFRLGDFYEMFGEDAIKSAPILNIVLTKRNEQPMCGIPYHSLTNYLSKLVNAGLKVAICEQLEEPTKGKTLIKRDVVRLITPGTILEEELLDSSRNNYLFSVYIKEGRRDVKVGFAYLDISTGEFKCSELEDNKNLDRLLSEVSYLNPNEFLFPKSFNNSTLINKISRDKTVNYLENYYYSRLYSEERIIELFEVPSLKSLGLDDKELAVSASGGIIAYIEKTQKGNFPTLNKIKYYNCQTFMSLDESAVQNLELIENASTRTKENSLLEIIDKTLTPIGSRFIKKWLLRPLLDKKAIEKRQEKIKTFIEEGFKRRNLREILKKFADVERIIARISAGIVRPNELISLKNSLKLLPEIQKQTNENFTSQEIEYVTELIEKSIDENASGDPTKGGVIKPGYSKSLDKLRNTTTQAKNWILNLESEERKRTGIPSLKIGYTSVFGYYIEITKPNLHLVPKDYIRKQTLTNCERFITPKLKEYEEMILSNEEKILKLELELFNEVKSKILQHSDKIYQYSSKVGELDVFLSLAEVAIQNEYTKPEISEEPGIYIEEGRHPVVEKKLKDKSFVPNDATLNRENQIIVLTGPNMSGKSTYLRQIALITILAQMGSYVPAKKAKIGIVDKIFTRIGAADNLAAGMSTFMLEMQETANILHNSTNRSLLLLDEIGRGTSTYDGIAIAWAVIEYLAKKTSANVIFATHYFELTELASKFPNIKNYNVSVREWEGEIIFLYKITKGISDRSYGIHVARLAGLPREVINRAKTILNRLEKNVSTDKELIAADADQLPLFQSQPHILQHLINLDPNEITPNQALKILYQIKEIIDGKKKI